jgi:hypothetical protein
MEVQPDFGLNSEVLIKVGGAYFGGRSSTLLIALSSMIYLVGAAPFIWA